MHSLLARLHPFLLAALLPAIAYGATPTANTADFEPLPLPYWKQTENLHEPERTCSLTSLAMVTDYLGLTDPSSHGRTPDFLFEQLNGVRQTVAALQDGFNTLARQAGSELRAYSKTDGTITELREALAAGHPVIVHGWFTPSGHIVVVTGFDGQHYTVHDPNGRWDLEKWGSYDNSVSGAHVRYPKKAFELAINDNGTGDDLWLHVFR